MTAFKVGDKVRRINVSNGDIGHQVGDVDVVCGFDVWDYLVFRDSNVEGAPQYYELVEDVSEETLRRQVVAWKQERVENDGYRPTHPRWRADAALYDSAVLIEKDDTKPDPAVEALKSFDTDNAGVDVTFADAPGRSTLSFSDALAKQVVDIVDNARKAKS